MAVSGRCDCSRADVYIPSGSCGVWRGDVQGDDIHHSLSRHQMAFSISMYVGLNSYHQTTKRVGITDFIWKSLDSSIFNAKVKFLQKGI